MRSSIRSLLKAREFTLVAIAIIAIGIGANTAVFSIVDAALLRPLPFKDPGRLFILAASNPKRAISDGPFSYPSFVELKARDTMLGGLAALGNERFNASDGDRPEQLPGGRVSASFFDVLGVNAAVGRTFTAAEDKAGAPAVAVIGRRYWTRRFGGSASAVGATLTSTARRTPWSARSASICRRYSTMSTCGRRARMRSAASHANLISAGSNSTCPRVYVLHYFSWPRTRTSPSAFHGIC